MSRPIEDYALIGDTRTAALVSRDGSIDWLCLPSFDSGACFAALVGEAENGAWSLAPQADSCAVRRAYREDSLVLETTYEDGGGGRVRVVDAMLPSSDAPRVVRLVIGRGRPGGDAVPDADPVRLRPHRAVDPPHGGDGRRGRRPGCAGLVFGRSAARRRSLDRRRVLGRSGRSSELRDGLLSFI